MEFKFSPGATPVRLLRGTIRSLLADHGFDARAVENTLLGLDEVLMNACTHGTEGEAGEVVELGVRMYRDRVAFEILDHGDCEGASFLSAGLPKEDSERGRGLFLIHHTMDEVSFHKREGGGTLVRLVKRR